MAHGVRNDAQNNPQKDIKNRQRNAEKAKKSKYITFDKDVYAVDENYCSCLDQHDQIPKKIFSIGLNYSLTKTLIMKYTFSLKLLTRCHLKKSSYE